MQLDIMKQFLTDLIAFILFFVSPDVSEAFQFPWSQAEVTFFLQNETSELTKKKINKINAIKSVKIVSLCLVQIAKTLENTIINVTVPHHGKGLISRGEGFHLTQCKLTAVSDLVTTLPMVEWRDPIEEDIERNLESVSRITGGCSGGAGVLPAITVYEAFLADHKSLPDEKGKHLKELRTDINQRRDGFAKIEDEEDPVILTGLLFEWLEGLKQPVLDREDLSIIVGKSHSVDACILSLDMEDVMLLEYLLRFVTRLRPLSAAKKVDILKRLLASLTHQSVSFNGKYLPNKDFTKLRDGTCNQIINFMLKMIVEIQKDMIKPGKDDADVVVPYRRSRIKAWK